MTEQYEEIAEMFRSVGRSYSHTDIETRMGQLYDPDRLLALLKEKDEEILGLKAELATEQALHRRASDTIGLLSKGLEQAEQKVEELTAERDELAKALVDIKEMK